MARVRHSTEQVGTHAGRLLPLLQFVALPGYRIASIAPAFTERFQSGRCKLPCRVRAGLPAKMIAQKGTSCSACFLILVSLPASLLTH